LFTSVVCFVVMATAAAGTRLY